MCNSFRLDDNPRGPRLRGRGRDYVFPLAQRVLTILLVLLILLMGTSSVSGQQSDGGDGGGNGGNNGLGSSNGAPTTFRPAHCPFKLGAGIIEGQQVSCGYVRLPENRAVKNGKMISLAVAIFKAPQYMRSIDPAPVLRLEGGPGSSSLGTFGALITAANYHTLIFRHNLILFDQRGVGYSTPSLKCSELSSQVNSDQPIVERLIPQNLLEPTERLYRACYERLSAAGIDLNNFNTLQNADDVADLIHALGYQRMTLYGASYGTLLELMVMRRHPDVVRAAVLDSVVPPDAHPLSLDFARNTERAFNVLFQGCARSASCNARYPNLRQVLYTLVDTLNASPVHLVFTDPVTKSQQSVTLTGILLLNWVFTGLYGTSLIPFLPGVIYQLKDHDYRSVPFFLQFTRATRSTLSDGMYYSVECSWEWPSITQQDLNNSIKGITPQIATFRSINIQLSFDICQSWKVKPVPVAQKQPVVSDLPALVLAGEYDPITPPSYGRRVAQNLSNSYFFLFPGQGHGELYSSTCSNRIISAFEDDPSRQPDASCIAQMSGPNFQ